VLDCFLGSATTAVAALNTKRNFIGCEIDEGYYIKSMERIERLMNE
jgi:site-specific DNA-methyltransferase (adenine-specific)